MFDTGCGIIDESAHKFESDHEGARRPLRERETPISHTAYTFGESNGS